MSNSAIDLFARKTASQTALRIPSLLLFSTISKTTIDVSVSSIVTGGYSVAGIGGWTYVSDGLANAALMAAYPTICTKSSDGRYWRAALIAGRLSIAATGAIADSTSYTTGTDNGTVIAKTIGYVWSLGGGRVVIPGVAQSTQDLLLENRLGYGWKGMLVVPSNIIISGESPLQSVLRKIDTNGTAPGIEIGTFGPSNGTSLSSCPKYIINDISTSAASLGNKIVCATPSDAANFAVGDIVGIEGTYITFGNPGQYNPNMAARVNKVDVTTGTITFDHAVDDGDGQGYVTSGSIRPGIRKLRNDAVTAATDCAGQNWSLFCATRAGLENLSIDQPNTTGWATPNLSVYECRFSNLEINGFYIAGNPVAYTLFEDVKFNYYGSIVEMAYMSHDTLFRRCTFARHAGGVGNVQTVPLIWINQGEGGKRINFERLLAVDRADITGTTYPQALGLRTASTIIDSKIVIPKGYFGYTQGGCVIRNSTLLCDATGIGANAGLAVYADTLDNVIMRCPGVGNSAIIAQGYCTFLENTIGDHSNPPTTLLSTDRISLSTGASQSRRRGNKTAKFGGESIIWNSSYANTFTATSTTTSSSLADIPKSVFLRLLDLDWRVTVDAFVGWSGTGTFTINLNGYDVNGTLYTLASWTSSALASSTGHLQIFYQHHEPGSQNAAYSISLQVGTLTALYGKSVNSTVSGGINGTSIVGFNLSVSGMTNGDTFTIQSGYITYDPLGAL